MRVDIGVEIAQTKLIECRGQSRRKRLKLTVTNILRISQRK